MVTLVLPIVILILEGGAGGAKKLLEQNSAKIVAIIKGGIAFVKLFPVL